MDHQFNLRHGSDASTAEDTKSLKDVTKQQPSWLVSRWTIVKYKIQSLRAKPIESQMADEKASVSTNRSNIKQTLYKLVTYMGPGVLISIT